MTQYLQIALEAANMSALDALAPYSGKQREELVAQTVKDLLALEQVNWTPFMRGWPMLTRVA